MSNYSKKQYIFAVYILKQFGIEDTAFIDKFLQYYAMAYGYYREYESGIFFNTSQSIEELLLEKNIRKDRNKIQKKDPAKNYFNATDFSNFAFCPVSFAINYSFIIEHPTEKKQTNIGIELHHKLNLIKRVETCEKPKSIEDSIFEHPEILKILNSKVVYYGHGNENKQSFFNKVNNIVCDPDYIFLDSKNEHFVEEEKYHNYKDPKKATYDEKWLAWNGYFDAGEKRIERVENWENFNPIFFRNHQIQVITYLKNIEKYALKYEYLIYWYYEFNGDNEPYVHKVGVKKIVLDNYSEEFYSQTTTSIKNLLTETKQKFEVENINLNKCAGCVVYKYCRHKSKKYDKYTFPYSLDYLQFFPAEFPEELKKTNL
jgi:hypothetical protein